MSAALWAPACMPCGRVDLGHEEEKAFIMNMGGLGPASERRFPSDESHVRPHRRRWELGGARRGTSNLQGCEFGRRDEKTKVEAR